MTVPWSRETPFDLKANLVAQAASIVTVVAALILGGGALCLIFRLLYLRVSWSPVLGQLPHDLYLASGLVQVFLPAALVAVALEYAHRWKTTSASSGRIKRAYRSLERKALPVLLLITAAGLAGVGILVHYLAAPDAESNTSGGPWPIGLIAVVLGLISWLIMLITAAIRRRSGSRLIKFAATTVLLVPIFAAVAACTLLPKVDVCGSGFVVPKHSDYHVLRGDLIGINGDTAYVAQWRIVNDQPVDGFIDVVPLSTQAVIAIGIHANCGDVPAVTGPAAF